MDKSVKKVVYGKEPGGRIQAKYSKKEYLLESQERLKRDVLPYLNLIKEKGGWFGFWGMIRLLMPVINDVGVIRYPADAKDAVSSGKVLADLGVPFPHLTWLLFRNNLLHRDEMTLIINEETSEHADWGISIGGGHQEKPGLTHIDVEKVYEDLYAYIGDFAKESAPEEVVFVNATYVDQSKSWLKDEYDKLFSGVDATILDKC